MRQQHLHPTQKTIASSQSQTAMVQHSPHPIEQLQSAIGNRAVNQLLESQPKLQAKPMFRGLSHELVIQPKLTIGAVGDKYEQEADRIAANVVSKIHAPQSQVVQREKMPEEDEELGLSPTIQRCSIQRREETIGGGEASLDVESAINSAKGSGQPLDAGLKQSLGQTMGADFSGVRVHTDPQSDRLNRSIQAKAFTTGQDVFFRQGLYQPGSRSGQELIAHELTHVVQQKGLSQRQTSLDENNPVRVTKKDTAQRSIQRAIGLEVEVAVPVDNLTAGELAIIQNAAGHDPNNIPPPNLQVMTTRRKKVPYTRGGGLKPQGTNHYRVEVDHDSRVNSTKQPPFPYRDTGESGLMEIVMDPPANDLTEFNTAMTEIQAFVDEVNTSTNNLTEHAQDPYNTGFNIGPIDYPALGSMPKESSHNWKGSIQVNIGIDLREYASLAKWYADSSYAKPRNAPQGERALYTKAQNAIKEAVNVGRQITDEMLDTVVTTRTDRENTGNLRGFRGWITHMALYLIGGREGLPEGSTVKNLTPILMKSPGQIAAHYGMTDVERQWFEDNRVVFMKRLIQRTRRTDLAIDTTDPNTLANLVVAKGTLGTPQGYTLDQLSQTQGDDTHLTAPIAAGASVNTPSAVGPQRQGNLAVQGIDPVNGNQRGGVVVEFRNLPGLYDGLEQWKALGKEFLKQAEKRNRRGGIKPK
jgi:Domain of unknown function (DUF4157)